MTIARRTRAAAAAALLGCSAAACSAPARPQADGGLPGVAAVESPRTDAELLAWPEPHTAAEPRRASACLSAYGLCTSTRFPLRGDSDYTSFDVSRRHLLVAFAMGASERGIHALLAPLGARITGAVPELGYAVIDFDRAFDFEHWDVRTTEQGPVVMPEHGPIESLASHPLIAGAAHELATITWERPAGWVSIWSPAPAADPGAALLEPPLPAAGESVSLLVPTATDPWCVLAAHIMPRRPHEQEFSIIISEHPLFFEPAPPAPCCGPDVCARQVGTAIWLGRPAAGRYRVRARQAQIEFGVTQQPIGSGDWPLDVRVKLAVVRASSLRCPPSRRAAPAQGWFARALARRHPELTEAQRVWLLAAVAAVRLEPRPGGNASWPRTSSFAYRHARDPCGALGATIERGTASVWTESGREHIEVWPADRVVAFAGSPRPRARRTPSAD